MSVMSDTVYIYLIIVSDEWICKQHFTVTCILQYYNINVELMQYIGGFFTIFLSLENSEKCPRSQNNMFKLPVWSIQWFKPPNDSVYSNWRKVKAVDLHIWEA